MWQERSSASSSLRDRPAAPLRCTDGRRFVAAARRASQVFRPRLARARACASRAVTPRADTPHYVKRQIVPPERAAFAPRPCRASHPACGGRPPRRPPAIPRLAATPETISFHSSHEIVSDPAPRGSTAEFRFVVSPSLKLASTAAANLKPAPRQLRTTTPARARARRLRRFPTAVTGSCFRPLARCVFRVAQAPRESGEPSRCFICLVPPRWRSPLRSLPRGLGKERERHLGLTRCARAFIR